MTTDAAPRRAAMPTWLLVAICGAFGLLYAFVVFSAVTLLVTQANGPLGLNGFGWTLLTAAAFVPVVAFGVAFAVGWRRRPGILALMLLVGLCLAAVFWLNVIAYAYTSGANLLGG